MHRLLEVLASTEHLLSRASDPETHEGGSLVRGGTAPWPRHDGRTETTATHKEASMRRNRFVSSALAILFAVGIVALGAAPAQAVTWYTWPRLCGTFFTLDCEVVYA